MSDRLEEIRRKLLERGYLEGRIERFVLKDLYGPGSPGRHLITTGLKAALLGAPLLGGLLAGAAVAANRPLLGATDALVLWLYFGALAAMALFLLNLAAAATIWGLARRRGVRKSDLLGVAMLVGILLLAYLVLLWWARQPGTGRAGDLLFLASALVAVLLIAWLAGLVSLAGIIGLTGEVPDRARKSVLAIVLVLLPVAGAFFLLLGGVGRLGRGEAPSPFAPAGDRARLLLVGVDGLDGALLAALEAHGAVDDLLALMARGAVFPKESTHGLEPPGVWTTVLTGMPAEIHGIRSVGSERLPGVVTPLRRQEGPIPLEAALRFLLPSRTIPTSGAVRSVRTLWEIIGLKEPAAAIGWWASWPARLPDDSAPMGYVVSDRTLPKLLSGGRQDRDTYPEALFSRLQADFKQERAAIRGAFEERFRDLGDASPALWESFLIDSYSWRIAEQILSDPSVRAGFVYLPGLDILRQRLPSRASHGTRGAVETVETDEALAGYLRWLTSLLMQAAESRQGWRVLIVADPGRSAAADGEGFVIALGPGARAGCVGPRASDLDITPLALALSGFPRSAEMRGHVPSRCLDILPTLPTPIPTFGRRGISGLEAASDYEPEMLERLRSLGYLR